MENNGVGQRLLAALIQQHLKSFEKPSILFKVTEDENLTAGIHIVFRGLKFESDAEIGQKGTTFKAFTLSSEQGKYYGQEDTDDDAGGDRKIKRNLLSFKKEVSG
jgi:hypothetical protein